MDDIPDILQRQSGDRVCREGVAVRSAEPNSGAEFATHDTESRLCQSIEEMQMIYDGMVEGVLITNIQSTQFVLANSSMCRMLGYTETELLKLSIKDIHPPAEVPEDLRRFRASAAGQTWLNEERPVLCKDGSIFFADISGRAIVWDDRPCLLALFRDVSERRQAQENRKRQQESLELMLRVSDHERQLIAYDIHDGLAQQLAAAIMQFQAADLLRTDNPADASKAFHYGMDLLRKGHTETRRLISGLRPPVLDASGVVAAINHLVEEPILSGGPKIVFEHDVQFNRLAPMVENAIYRICQEAVTNAIQHSHSNEVRVVLVQRNDEVSLTIRDWGVGFDSAAIRVDRYGLEGIRQRARLLGGQTTISSVVGQGTAVSVELPLRAEPCGNRSRAVAELPNTRRIKSPFAERK